MRKIYFVFAFLILGSTLNATTSLAQIDCNNLSIAVSNAYESAGYSYYEAYLHGQAAYEGCVSDGGNPGDSIVIL